MASLFIARRFMQFTPAKGRGGFLSFITAISIVGVALGVAALLIALTILGGFERELKEKVIGFSSHIQITGYQNRVLTNWKEAERTVKIQFPSVRTVAPFVLKEGMVSRGDVTDGVIVKGIDPSREHGVAQYIIEGTYALSERSDNLSTCLIGRKLLVKLGASLNDTLLVFGLPGTAQNIRQPTVAAFVIGGVYESGMSEYDDVYLFTTLAAAQRLFNYWDGITGFDITLSTPDSATVTAQAMAETLGYPYFARTVYQLYRNLFTWIELQKEPIPVILGLIIAVAAVNIIGTMLMFVLEKKKQIGVLRSMGASRSAIRRLFLMQGLGIALVGTAAGDILSFVVCWLQLEFHFFTLPSSVYFMNSVPIYLTAGNFLLVSSVSIVLCVGASYIPAYLASKLDPIRAIRFN